MDKADLYRTSPDNKARYVLGAKGNKPLIVIGVNPSTATDTKFDATIRKIVGFSNKHNFDGWVTINVYPQRATNPANLQIDENSDFHKTNLIEIDRLVKSLKGNPITIWAAWGDIIETRPFLKNCLKGISSTLKPYHPKWITIGSATKRGNPRHPSRLSYQEKVAPFDIESYLNSVST